MAVKGFDSYQLNPQVESSIVSEYHTTAYQKVLMYYDTLIHLN